MVAVKPENIEVPQALMDLIMLMPKRILDVNDTDGLRNFRKSLVADVLAWIANNPVRPDIKWVRDSIEEMIIRPRTTPSEDLQDLCAEWQRRMFLAPLIPYELRNLLKAIGLTAESQGGKAIMEAYRLGKQGVKAETA